MTGVFAWVGSSADFSAVLFVGTREGEAKSQVLDVVVLYALVS